MPPLVIALPADSLYQATLLFNLTELASGNLS